MPVATISFSHAEQAQVSDWPDIYGLADTVLSVLDRYFIGYDQAAEAQEQYKCVQADIDADTSLTLFGTCEAIRAGLAAHPAALSWSEFETEAGKRIEPYRFSIRFTN